MAEKSKESTNLELLMGGLFVLVGALALLGEMNTAMAEAIFRLWPAGLIGWGIALLFRTEAGR